MITPAIWREKAHEAATAAELHDNLALQSCFGAAEHHRSVAAAYRWLAGDLFRLALHVDGGDE
jgi:hypothetical protein